MPDRSYRLALATYADEPELSADDALLVPALAAAGIEAVAIPWASPDFDWHRVDAVLLRSTWDYVEHPEAFLDWLEALPVPVFNSPGTVRWNSDKRYLATLDAAGVAIVPTQFVSGAEMHQRLGSFGRDTVIVKPAISASARGTWRGQADDPAFQARVRALPADRCYLLQPYVAQIETVGEWSLIYLAGAFSHAVLKRPAAGDFRVQSAHGGRVAAAEAPAGLRAQAGRVMQALPVLGLPMPLYARVDGIVVDGTFQLMELELIEPALHWFAHPQAPVRMARAIAQRFSVDDPAGP